MPVGTLAFVRLRSAILFWTRPSGPTKPRQQRQRLLYKKPSDSLACGAAMPTQRSPNLLFQLEEPLGRPAGEGTAALLPRPPRAAPLSAGAPDCGLQPLSKHLTSAMSQPAPLRGIAEPCRRAGTCGLARCSLERSFLHPEARGGAGGAFAKANKCRKQVTHSRDAPAPAASTAEDASLAGAARVGAGHCSLALAMGGRRLPHPAATLAALHLIGGKRMWCAGFEGSTEFGPPLRMHRSGC